jgi:hypothetical protein
MLQRRKHRRFKTRAPVLCSWKDASITRVAEGITRDIGVGGMYILGAHAPPAKFAVRCQVLLPALEAWPQPTEGTVAEVVGRVLRDETKTGTQEGFAVQFHTMVLNRVQ